LQPTPSNSLQVGAANQAASSDSTAALQSTSTDSNAAATYLNGQVEGGQTSPQPASTSSSWRYIGATIAFVIVLVGLVVLWRRSNRVPVVPEVVAEPMPELKPKPKTKKKSSKAKPKSKAKAKKR
jgi:hypothetical protein